MRSQKKLIMLAVTIFITLALNPRLGLTATPCEDLATVDFGPNVTITSAIVVPETPELPEHCKVEGVRFYDPFIIKLPTEWNERYYQVGNGGAAGSINESGIDSGLQKGFAAAGASGGHDNNPPFPMFVWGFPPNDPAAQQKLDDYCFGSVHETAVLTKQIIVLYYDRGPEFSYYNACSTGGRQGLIEAQRYPEDFDGLLIGAPVHELTRITQRGVWEAQAQLGDGAIAPEKLPLLAAAVMKECDSNDGLVDGLIDDPRKCDFNALMDLPFCPGDVDADDCFTTAQREAIKKIYDGPTGDAATPGEAFGTEAFAPGFGGQLSSGWIPWIVPTTPFPDPPAFTLGHILGAGFVQWVGLPPSGGGGPTWDWTTYDFGGPDPQSVIDNMSARCDAIDPDLWELKGLGGKIIHWDGWADPATGAYQSAEYYDEVLFEMGETETNEFYKLYMLPGTAHCGGGLGCFDSNGDLDNLFKALVDWVEDGVEPGSWVGSRIVDGEVVRTRPQCPYPEVARYLGKGSIDEVQNFTCVEVIPAKIRIEPETLKLGSKGKFTAFIEFPKSYDMSGWERIAVVSEGASEVKGKIAKKNKAYQAKFNRQDLVNITAGDAVTFTVTAVFERDGQRLAFEGSDDVRVLP